MWVSFTIITIIFISQYYERFLFLFALANSIFIFFLTILLWFTSLINFVEKYLENNFTVLNEFILIPSNWNFYTLDALSILFVTLTALIFPFCFLAIQKLPLKKFLILTLFSIEGLLFVTFSTSNLLLFYVCFEAILLPMFYLIIVWGSRSRKIKAAYYLFLYTAIGSIFFFLSFGLFYYDYANFLFTRNFTTFLKFQQFESLYFNTDIEFFRQLIIWFGFFITFAIKIPIFPFHIWLPEAHVEAPTIGSVILASLLLKIGGYGIIKFLLVFERATVYMQPLFYWMCVTSVIFASFSALRQIDIKKIIAYSSIAHMNFVVLSLLTLTYDGLYGGILLMIGHGIISGALFLLIGVLYERYHSRNIFYYSGLTTVMPLTSFLFFFFSISNFSFPGTANFIAEVLILKSIFQTNLLLGLILLLSSFITVAYSILLFNRLFFGNLKILHIEAFTDLTRAEVYYFLPLVFLNFLFGFYPNIFLSPIFSNSLFYFFL